ncbi:MAG: hypothetical protein J5843_04740, partial [Clostridia bacterium]|nr:hypothetical protein [Clostridia bacterium]
PQSDAEEPSYDSEDENSETTESEDSKSDDGPSDTEPSIGEESKSEASKPEDPKTDEPKDDDIDADIILRSAETPFDINDATALAYTSSGTSFRTKDRIQIMEASFFLEQYDLHANEHTNNGKVPYFPNGVLLLVDPDHNILEARIAAGALFERGKDGKWKTEGLSWTNAIDAGSGGGLFKGIREEVPKVLKDGGYLLFCGNIGDQVCRISLIRSLLVSGYQSGAISPDSIDVPASVRTIAWTEGGSKDPDGPKQQTSGSSTLSAQDVKAGLPVYTGTLSGEVKPASPAVFDGAWYRKAVSSKSSWIGIEATVTLPTFTIRRYEGSYDATLDADPNAKNLDNPSVYLGGKCTYESDIGLSLSRALVKTATGTAVSTGNVCFRPFWRYITNEEQDAGGYDKHGGEYAVTANGSNCIGNYHYKYTEYYYLPGDTLRLMVFSPEENKLQFAIQVISVSTLPSSVALRERNGWKQPADFLSPVFRSKGYGTGAKTEYKRVCAIDQSGNEGKKAIATETESKGVVWREVYLYRNVDGKTVRVPMTENLFGARNAPDDAHVSFYAGDADPAKGGETVDLHPGYKN